MLFNGTNLSSHLKIRSISGRGLAESEVSTLSTSGGNGARFQRKRRPMRILKIEADIRAKNREELRENIDKINGILAVDQPVPITFFDEPDITYFGTPETASENDEYFFKHQGTFTIVCPDPFKYGKEQKITAATTYQTIRVVGTSDTPWTTQTTFGADADQFILEANTGLYVQLDYNFIQGDVLKIDYKYRKVTLNGKLLMTPISLQTNWLPLQPGYMQIRASHETEISYHERYY